MFFSCNIRNIFWKFEEDCLKSEREDRTLVTFKILKKIDSKKLWPRRFYQKLFTMITVSQKFSKFFNSVKTGL